MAEFPLMEGGFPDLLNTQQVGYGSPLWVLPDWTESDYSLQPSGPMWQYTYDVPASVTEELTGENPYGVVFDDAFSGIFEVDDVVDTLSDFDGVIDASED